MLDARDYAGALPMFTRLAAAGNAAAQFHLGEMYWYGEGVAADAAKGDEWFRKADAGGYGEARAALSLTAQRRASLKDIDYYVQRYDGADVALATAGCAAPAIPARSQKQEEIQAVGAGIDAWLACHNGFVQKLQGMLPAGKAIPAELTNVMTDAEVAQASTRMDRAYAAVSADARREADRIIAARDAWQAGTNAYVRDENDRLASEYERRAREKLDFATRTTQYREPTPTRR